MNIEKYKPKTIIWFLGIGSSILIFLFLWSSHTLAGAEHNLSGYAWTETTGWISFNSTNQGGAANYGVNIAADGKISGFAWSEHIGWVSFNHYGGCPVGPCEPHFNKTTGVVSGWARACAGTADGECVTLASRFDGWDGWIHLRDSLYGVSVDGCKWEGFAWGSDVVGWIHFRGATYGVIGTGDACREIVIPPLPQCSDNQDNDGDSKIDFPQDPGCYSSFDDDERNFEYPVPKPIEVIPK